MASWDWIELESEPSGQSSLVDSLLREFKRQLHTTQASAPEREDFELFYKRILGWKLPPYQKAVLPLLLDSSVKRLLILAPPGHSKTTLLVTFLAWQLGRDSNLRTIIATHTISYSIQLANQVAQLIAHPEFVRIFGNLIPSQSEAKWTSTEKFLRRSDFRISDPSILAIGVGSSTIGHRADLIVADDLVTHANSMTPTLRSHLRNWFYGSLEKRLEPEGRLIVIGARFFAQDLYGELLQQPSYRHIVFRASPEKPLWPERYDSKALADMQRSNYFAFQAQYMQEPVDLTRSFLREEWLRYYLERPPGPLRIYQGVDPCVSAKLGTDYFAHVTIGVDASDTAYLLDLVRCQATFEEQANIIRQQAEKWRPLLINIESNASQAFLADSVLTEASLPINRSISQVPKEVRLTTLGTHFKNGKVLLPGRLTPSGNIEPDPMAQPFVEEYRNFPFGHDDTLDAMCLAVEAAFALSVMPAAATEPAQEPAEALADIPSYPLRRRHDIFERPVHRIFH